MLNVIFLNTLAASYNSGPNYISELVNGANEYLGDAGSFQLRIAANDPCLLKLHDELEEDCALSTEDKLRLAIQWMNCMREVSGRKKVSENVAELDDYVYSSEFIIYLHRVETVCFWIDQQRRDLFDA